MAHTLAHCLAAPATAEGHSRTTATLLPDALRPAMVAADPAHPTAAHPGTAAPPQAP